MYGMNFFFIFLFHHQTKSFLIGDRFKAASYILLSGFWVCFPSSLFLSTGLQLSFFSF